jgi:hypothetical protein
MEQLSENSSGTVKKKKEKKKEERLHAKTFQDKHATPLLLHKYNRAIVRRPCHR